MRFWGEGRYPMVPSQTKTGGSWERESPQSWQFLPKKGFRGTRREEAPLCACEGGRWGGGRGQVRALCSGGVGKSALSRQNLPGFCHLLSPLPKSRSHSPLGWGIFLTVSEPRSLPPRLPLRSGLSSCLPSPPLLTQHRLSCFYGNRPSKALPGGQGHYCSWWRWGWRN